MPGLSHDEVLMLAASVEKRSEHPIGDAIVAAAEAKGLILSEPESFEALPGFGIQASVNGRMLQIGADRLLAKRATDLTRFSEQARRLGEEGKTPVYVAIDGALAAILAVADPVKQALRLLLPTFIAWVLKLS